MNPTSDIIYLLNEVHTLTNAYELVEIANGDRFNVFTLLGLESDEVITHSRIIAELLNTEGNHGQKDVFLKLFLKTFHKEDFVFNTRNSKITVEYHVGKVTETEGGRIDIIIKDLNGNVIMIENKIYASEQPNQLLRYRNAFKDGRLFYLTLNGINSEQNHHNVDYEPLSYKYDIVYWLQECKKEAVNMPMLRETIQQYINLIKKLTGQNINTKMTDDIINLLLRDAENIKTYSILLETDITLRKKMMLDIINKLKIRLEKSNSISVYVSDFITDKGMLFYVENENLKHHKLIIKFNFESANYSKLIFGFANIEKTREKDPILLDLTKNQYPTAKQSDWWNAYMPFDNYSYWDYNTLSKIYFDSSELFYSEVEDKIQKLLHIFELRLKQNN